MARLDAKTIKEMNKKEIRKAFYKIHVQTAAELSKMTGLSVVTTNGLLREMRRDKEVLMSATQESNGGRPASKYQYNRYYKCMAVIYGYEKNEKDFITMVITDIFGQCVVRESAIMENIKRDSFQNLLDKAFDAYATIGIIAFGLPGEEADGTILYNDYTDIIGDDFMKYYKEKYQVPVLFINDINAAVNGYFHRNKCTYKNVAGIFFPRKYNPGAGFIINEEIYTGFQGFAGEIGFLPKGIDWKALDYQNEKQILEAVSNVVAIIACIMAPDKIVLYGDFFHEGIETEIEQRIKSILQAKYQVQITISTDFASDFEYGMICQSLHELQGEEGDIK